MINLGEVNHLPSKVVWYQVSSIVIVIFLISLFISFKFFWPVFITLIVIIALPVLLMCFINYKFFSFVVENDKITTKSGMLSRNTKTIPFSRVQTVDSKQGLWMRLFNLSIVKIWTASPQQVNNTKSNSKPDMAMVLANEDVEQLKNIILGK